MFGGSKPSPFHGGPGGPGEKFGAGEVQAVRLAPNMDKEEYASGKTRLTVVTAERQYSSNILIDAKDRLFGRTEEYDFSVDLGANLFRPRIATVQRVTIPVINNVTPMNNTLTFATTLQAGGVHVLTYYTVTLLPAMYDTATLANEIANRMSAAVGDLEIHFICSFNTVIQTFTLTVVVDNAKPQIAFALMDSSFFTRGKYLHGFPYVTQDQLNEIIAGWDEATGIVLPVSVRSGRASMLYTRFITIHSERLTHSAYENSRTSDIIQGKNIIAIVDISSMYDDNDFDVAVPFCGIYKTIATPEAPNICVLNSEKNMTSIIDLQFKDEYGTGLDDVMKKDDTREFGVPLDLLPAVYYKRGPNTLGPALWLEVFF